MGSCCSVETEEVEAWKGSGGEVHIVIVALDYEYCPGSELTCHVVHIVIVALDYEYCPGSELTCHVDAQTMSTIAGRAGITNVTLNTDKDGVGGFNFPTRKVLLNHLTMASRSCQPGDWFVFFFAGHGINIPDANGDEVSGFDQAFVTPSRAGKLTKESVLIDDEFSRAIDMFVPEGVRILVICDCCHSGSICDIDSYKYDHDIYQFSAAQNDEEAADIGGGVLTTALNKALVDLSWKTAEYSIQTVFDKTNEYARKLAAEQHLEFQWKGTDPRTLAWPLGYGTKDIIAGRRTELSAYEVREDLAAQ